MLLRLRRHLITQASRNPFLRSPVSFLSDPDRGAIGILAPAISMEHATTSIFNKRHDPESTQSLVPGSDLMKALCWHGKENLSVDTVPDPKILDPRDVILKITSTAICGSDLHLYGGLMPTMEDGDILGHEPMGEVVEVGSAVRKFKIGDRAVVPFTISCGECFFCRKG